MSRPRRRGGQKRTSTGNDNAQQAAAKAARRDFWGRELTEDERIDRVTIASDPSTVVRSLGPPPLAGRDVIAEHYFAAVYEKASGVATALAAAAGVLVDDDDQ